MLTLKLPVPVTAPMPTLCKSKPCPTSLFGAWNTNFWIHVPCHVEEVYLLKREWATQREKRSRKRKRRLPCIPAFKSLPSKANTDHTFYNQANTVCSSHFFNSSWVYVTQSQAYLTCRYISNKYISTVGQLRIFVKVTSKMTRKVLVTLFAFSRMTPTPFKNACGFSINTICWWHVPVRIVCVNYNYEILRNLTIIHVCRLPWKVMNHTQEDMLCFSVWKSISTYLKHRFQKKPILP